MLHLMGMEYWQECPPDLTALNELASLYDEIGETLGAKYPLFGRDAFVTRAGIHADGLNNSGPCTPLFNVPLLVGRDLEVALTKDSGTAGFLCSLCCGYDEAWNWGKTIAACSKYSHGSRSSSSPAAALPFPGGNWSRLWRAYSTLTCRSGPVAPIGLNLMSKLARLFTPTLHGAAAAWKLPEIEHSVFGPEFELRVLPASGGRGHAAGSELQRAVEGASAL